MMISVELILEKVDAGFSVLTCLAGTCAPAFGRAGIQLLARKRVSKAMQVVLIR